MNRFYLMMSLRDLLFLTISPDYDKAEKHRQQKATFQIAWQEENEKAGSERVKQGEDS